MSDILEQIISWIGVIITILFYLTPVIPFYQVLVGKLDYKKSPGILLILLFINCILWACYKKDYYYVYYAYGISGSLTLIWITIYLIFLGKKNFGLSLGFNLGFLTIIIFIMLLFFLVIDKKITGYIAMVFNLLIYIPLGKKIYILITSYSYNYKLYSIFASILGFIYSLCWIICGIYQSDWILYVTNSLNCIFAFIASILFFRYLKKKRKHIRKYDDLMI